MYQAKKSVAWKNGNPPLFHIRVTTLECTYVRKIM